ncbi:targeting protein for Xklp2-A-like isoform X2 [Varroa destructor]|uniref:TPX2 C-terminal domain-containing protein n=1 Tax=Varroa destructor TaxID=109461 RepID=A0A7M7JT74_VARDE|nr:targeting protein for Xklp2-A-like isoform X2 [Varroa destructor]
MASSEQVPAVLARSEIARRRFEQKLEQNEVYAQGRRKFHARECEVTRRKPFQPVLFHNFTTPDHVVLHSTARAEERRKFDELLDEKNREKIKVAEKERIRREEAEKEALKTYRQRLEFKARPLPGTFAKQKNN